MKLPISITRIIVGILFIFSGLVKANDPLGLSYKMQEFFELWGMTQFNSWTLTFSVLIIAFEIIAGVALLIGWKMQLFSWLLLLLIIFFTFLTGYAHLSGKFKNCGCFGDCIPITARMSFIKDIILSLLIIFLFINRKYITPVFSSKGSAIAMTLATLFSFGIQWYTLNYLPIVDCLPFKKGNNIIEKMKMPANAVPDSTVITFVYDKAGTQVEFTADNFPADFNSTTYKLVSRYDKVIRKGKNNEPPIKGFVLTGSAGDSTSYILQQPEAILFFVENFSVPVSKWKSDFEEIYTSARQKGVPVYGIARNRDEMIAKIKGTSFEDMPVYNCDFTAIRTAARTSPCVYLLRNGTVVDKWSYKTMSAITAKLGK